MKVLEVKAKRREKTGKGPSRRLRRSGYLPAVVYGGGRKEATHIAVSAKDVRKLKHHHGLIRLDIEGDERICILKDIQYNWLGDVPIHLDFQEVRLDETVEVTVELEFTGTPVGVSEEGGILEILKREITIEVFPDRIPEKIVVDLSNLRAGSAIHAGDIEIPEGAKLVDDPSETVAVVVEQEEEAPSGEEEKAGEE